MTTDLHLGVTTVVGRVDDSSSQPEDTLFDFPEGDKISAELTTATTTADFGFVHGSYLVSLIGSAQVGYPQSTVGYFLFCLRNKL
jgi:hypothetical protein